MKTKQFHWHGLSDVKIMNLKVSQRFQSRITIANKWEIPEQVTVFPSMCRDPNLETNISYYSILLFLSGWIKIESLNLCKLHLQVKILECPKEQRWVVSENLISKLTWRSHQIDEAYLAQTIFENKCYLVSNLLASKDFFYIQLRLCKIWVMCCA